MNELAHFTIISVIIFFYCVEMYGDREYPNFNKRPITGFVFTSILLWLILELLIWSLRVIFNN